jgi:hypothetical protein
MNNRNTNNGGRPTKLTPDLQNKIIEGIKAGNFPATAAAIEGIAESTFYRWMKWGRERKSGLFREFWEAVKNAERFAEAYHVQNVRKAADGDLEHGVRPQWQASAWWLERKFPKRWGKIDRIDHKVRGKIQQEHKINIDDALKRLKRIENDTSTDDLQSGTENTD